MMAGGRATSPRQLPLSLRYNNHAGMLTLVVVNLMEWAAGSGRVFMWKELGKALVVSVVIPVTVQVGAQLAEQYRAKLAKKTKFTIKLT